MKLTAPQRQVARPMWSERGQGAPGAVFISAYVGGRPAPRETAKASSHTRYGTDAPTRAISAQVLVPRINWKNIALLLLHKPAKERFPSRSRERRNLE